MFNLKTNRIKRLAEIFPKVITELNDVFNENTNVYIDWQNVIYWQNKLGFHIHLVRLKQFLDSFNTINYVKIYTGTIKISIDAAGVSKYSTSILDNFIKKNFLAKMDTESIKYLNEKILDLNKQGFLSIEERKCNFDVEISRDMQKDFESRKIKNFILWSTDSDFTDLIIQIKAGGGKIAIFATSGKVSFELSSAKIPVFDIKKIKEFICWPREIPKIIKDLINEDDNQPI